jgi:hypothetical protein
MSNGPLVPADETLNHQIVDTFATVGQTDLSWTEKVWFAAMARDGSLQIHFGLGKYTNRGVMDGSGGVARGQEQWTVRASRRLDPHPDVTAVGPIRYEVVEPLVSVRCILEPSAADIAFDVVFTGSMPPGLEDHWPTRSANGYRVSTDHLRYHQMGTVSGWVEVEGQRHQVDPQDWVAFRDRSWGVRPGVGQPMANLAPEPSLAEMFLVWSPMRLERPDGSVYGLFVMNIRTSFSDGRVIDEFQAAEEFPSGERRPFRRVTPALQFVDYSRHLSGGVLLFEAQDGTERPVTVTPVSDTSFYLGPAGYGGYGGYNHGDWRGELLVEGEHLVDTGSPDMLGRVHQIRDLLVAVEDPVGGGRGFAEIETVLMGDFSALGLSADTPY